MKRLFVIMGLWVGILLVLSISSSDNVKAGSRPRFEMILDQYHEPKNHSFEVFHDKETGQEIVCVYGGLDMASCYLTGRSWQ